MSWLLPRLLVMLASLGLGILAGHFAGLWLGSSELGTAVGAAAGVTLVVVIDTVRGARLLRWMRGDLALGAPRDAGFWAEVAYRSERAVRERDKAIADEQRKLAEFLQAIEASPNGVVLLDDHDQVSWCNAIAADHLGLDARRDLHQPITNLLRKPAFVAYLQSREWREPLMLAEPSGLSALQLVMRGYGERQTLLITQDVTERQRSDAMRRDFVANVSHEIRTPLTVLAGFVETMATLPLTGVERTRVLALMQQQTVRMQTLVADLLTLAQLEGSPRPAIDRWVSLPGLLERAAADGRTLSAGRHTVTVLPVPALELAGQESELFSSVVNLVGNAVRYTPDGGQISVSWQARPDGGGEVLVRDNGIGIAREHLGRLTERFYRVDGSRSRDTGGTGLGLAIVKHVMQRHGGTLEIDSEPGKGSCFRLGLPVGRLRAAAAAATQADDATSRVG